MAYSLDVPDVVKRQLKAVPMEFRRDLELKLRLSATVASSLSPTDFSTQHFTTGSDGRAYTIHYQIDPLARTVRAQGVTVDRS